MIAPGRTAGADRFEVRGRLGHGDMGIVYEAWDRTTSRTVALKVYRHDDDITQARVRRIFERLRGLRHRNVVELIDLIEEDGAPVLVMERVEGEDMMAYCAGRWRSEVPADAGARPARCDLARLRACLVQLVAGLVALHRHDVIHRDLKPSNLRVTADGRLVILDFSLSDGRGEGVVGGTVAYMAPEQAMIDASIGPGADWYAVGALAYEALAGHPPFVGAPQRVLQDKAAREPPAVESIVRDAPRDLVELCRRLLVPDPDRRPTDAELGAMLGLAAPTRLTTPAPAPRRHARAAEHVLERLRDAVDAGRAGLVTLVGEPGLGRSAALGVIADLIRATWPDALVLAPRTIATVEGDLLDALGEALAAALIALPATEQQAITPSRATALVPLLPALERVPSIAGLPAGVGRRGPGGLTDAIDALRELLTLGSRRRPVALLLDDLDTLDGDGARILADVLRGPDPPPVLLVGTCAAEDLLPALEQLVPVPLEWWSRKELERLIAERGVDDAYARGIVERSEGHPALARELARAVTLGELAADGGLVDVLAARIARLPASTREVLAAAALVPGGTPTGLLGRALDLGRSVLDARLAELDVAGLIVVHGAAALVAPASSAVRAALDAHPDAAATRRLAGALAAQGDELPAWILAPLWRLAGDDARAAEAGARAGARAHDRLRFVAATEAYRLAIDAGGDHHLAYADAAAAAGRGGEAARAYAEASARTDGATRVQLAVRAAELHILAGELDAGVAAYRHALDLAGISLASTPGRALPKLLLRRGWLRIRGVRFDPRPRADLAPFELARADACFSAGFHLGVLETVIGAELQSRALAHALRIGEPERLGFAMVLEAVYLTTQGAVGRAERLLTMARHTAGEVRSGRLAAFVELGTAAASFFHRNQFGAAVAALDGVVASTDAEPWAIEMAQSYAAMSVAYLGDVHELTRRVLRLVREAERRGDAYAAMVYRVRCNLAWLARGDADGAEEALAEAERRWPFDAERFRVPDYYRLYGRVEAALWHGDAVAANALLAAGLRPLERSMLTRVHHVRAETDFLAGRAAIAGAEGGDATAAVARWARRLGRNPVGLAPVFGALLRGCAAARDRSPEVAARALTEAIARADDLELGLHAAAARVRLGELVGGDEGTASFDRGLHELARLGVTDASRTVTLFAPV